MAARAVDGTPFTRHKVGRQLFNDLITQAASIWNYLEQLAS